MSKSKRVLIDNRNISITIEDDVVLLEAHLDCAKVVRGGYISQEISLKDLKNLIDRYEKLSKDL